jgi:SNF2 family DNA or RNA helicase
MAVKQMGLQADHRLGLSGTPLLNNPDDIWSIMNFIEPREYGSRNQFRNRYCRMQSAWHGGFENLGLKNETRNEFDRFFLPRFIRRTKLEVLPDLPEKMPVDYRVLPMGTKQRRVYTALMNDMMAVVDDELLMVENPLSLSLRLRQVACGVPVVDENGEVVALEAPSNKLDAILDILEESPDEPLVVYAESRKFIEMLAEQLRKRKYSVGLVTGAQSAREREKAVERFQAGKLHVMLGTLGAGAEGLTLTAASTIVLAQQSWAHATNAQAIDRIHRIGQNSSVHPIVLISEGTVDHAVALVDKTKEGRLQELVRDPAWMKAAMKGEIR